MKKHLLLSAGLIGTAMLNSTAFATESFGKKFVAFPTAGTTNAIGPELQLDEQHRIYGIFRSHMDAILMQQMAKAGNAPSGYAGGFTGLAAGDSGQSLTDNVSLWGSVNYSDSENDFTATAYESDSRSVSVGLDYASTDKINLGAYLSYSETDTDSSFNGGSSDTDAVAFAPYISYMFNNIYSVDFSVGITNSNIDNKRTVAGVVGKGSQDGDSTFASINFTAQEWNDNWGVTGRVGYSYYDTDNDSYTDSLGTFFPATDSQLGQVQVGLKLSYYTPNAMPYFGITYMNDVDSEDVITTTPPRPDNDDTEVLLEAGVSLFGKGPLSGGITANYSTDRTDYDAWSIGANISYRF